MDGGKSIMLISYSDPETVLDVATTTSPEGSNANTGLCMIPQCASQETVVMKMTVDCNSDPVTVLDAATTAFPEGSNANTGLYA